VTGQGFKGFTNVGKLEIGDLDVRPSPNPATIADGSFTTEFLVPQLDSGVQTVEADVGGTTASASFIITSAGVAPVVTTQDTDVVFAAEITSDNLVRVWRFDNETQGWAFFDPRPAFADANTLIETSSNDIVWVNVTDQTTFQAQTLFPGWNLISLD
jgi:hypothetical protein